MCVKRKVEEATFGSTVEYRGRLWVILSAELEDNIELVTAGLKEGQDIITIPFGTEVVSHHLAPIERRKCGFPKCELPLVELEQADTLNWYRS